MQQRRGVVLGLGAGLLTAACARPPLPPERAAYVTGDGGPPSGPAARAGLLLPLSGDLAEVGQALLDAARQALGETGGGPLVLVPQDTAPGAALAARRAVELGCGILIGPIGSADARAAAEVGRPLLALSNDSAIARSGLWPFGIEPETQAARVAGFAAGMGRSRLGALVPEDGYGARLLRGLQDALALRPGVVLTSTVTYPAGAVALPPDLTARLQNVDAVLVGGGGTVPAAAAALLASGTAPPRLLGTLPWLQEPDPGGVPLPAGAWIAVPDPAAGAGFAERHQRLFGRPASPLALLVADAVGLAAGVGASGGFTLPLLTRPEGFAGRLGAFRLLASGRVERLLAVAEVGAKGGLSVIDPAPAGFAETGT